MDGNKTEADPSIKKKEEEEGLEEDEQPLRPMLLISVVREDSVMIW